MATETQSGSFEDIDLEDTHQAKQNHGYDPTGKNDSYRVAMINHADTSGKGSNMIDNVLSKLSPILPVLHKIKNAVLMIPACFILCIISFVAYCTLILALPYRLQQCSETGSIGVGIFTLVLGILFVCTALLTISSFIRCVLTSSQVKDNPPTTSSVNINAQSTRTCVKCNEFKPARSHHCSICSACVLKMDHHCPWVSNCVGYFNYKYFCLFIWLATISCHLSSLICFTQLFSALEHSSSHKSSYRGNQSSWMMINSLLTLAFGITLTCFSFFHLLLVLKGSTTIEFGSEAYHPYNLGWKHNFYAIFGENCLFWFIPIPTMKGDGYEYNIQDEDNHTLLGNEQNVYRIEPDRANVFVQTQSNEQDKQEEEANDSMTNHDEDDQDNEISDFDTDLTS